MPFFIIVIKKKLFTNFLSCGLIAMICQATRGVCGMTTHLTTNTVKYSCIATFTHLQMTSGIFSWVSRYMTWLDGHLSSCSCKNRMT